MDSKAPEAALADERAPLNIAILAAGAGGMYCGSCLRDSGLASALIRMRQRVTLVPMYTPLRTEDGSIATPEVFYGGVNVYLQHASALFRHTPRLLDWLLDRPMFLALAGKFGTQTSPAQLGPLTLSILRGEHGPAVKELRRLVSFLKTDVRPQIVSLPNLMFVGLARLLREELGAPVVCELTGEDLFLGQLLQPHRAEAQSIIQARAADIDGFVATSAYYADVMARYLNIDRARIAVVHPGVPAEYISNHSSPMPAGRPRVVGYLARICPEKGFGQLIETMQRVWQKDGMTDTRLHAGGYLGAGDRKWFRNVMDRAQAPPGALHYAGELERDAKLALLDTFDVLCVPGTYPESKGIYVLEAMARGVPVVQPAHGSFPELVQLTGGGVLVEPGNFEAMASTLAELLKDAGRRAELGQAGRQSVRRGFTEDHMAAKMLAFYRSVLDAGARPGEAAAAVEGRKR